MNIAYEHIITTPFDYNNEPSVHVPIVGSHFILSLSRNFYL